MNNSVTVRLSPQDVITAGTVGLRRHVHAIFHRLRPTNGAPSNDGEGAFDAHIIGAIAEFVVARLLNLFWDPKIGCTAKGDVGGVVEVRVRRQEKKRDLVIKPKDADDMPYVLVHVALPSVTVVGWMLGGDAKDRARAGEFQWCEQREIWFVPPGVLRPIAELMRATAFTLSLTTPAKGA